MNIGFIRGLGGGGKGDGRKYIFENIQSSKENTWSTKAAVPTGRYSLTSSEVEGKIYVIGGSGSGTKNECYDPLTDTWSTKTDIPTGRNYLTSSEVDGKIYVIGGNGGNTANECMDFFYSNYFLIKGENILKFDQEVFLSNDISIPANTATKVDADEGIGVFFPHITSGTIELAGETLIIEL